METISLDSPRWPELRHAYGAAGDIPALLRQLPHAAVGGDYRTEPWYSLWSALCHQGDVYPASFAAVPHIVAAAEGRSEGDRADFLHLAGCIESYRHRPNAPALPPDLRPAYEAAVRRAAVMAVETLRHPLPAESYRVLLGCVAALQGHAALGAAVMDLAPEFACPNCDCFVRTPGYDMF